MTNGKNVFFLLFLILAGCGALNKVADQTADPIPTSQVSLTPSQLDLIVGESVTLNSNIEESLITWRSLNENIASVTGNGLVTGISEGVTTINVWETDNELNFLAVPVSVYQPPLAAPANFTVEGYHRNNLLSWTLPTHNYFKEVEIRRSLGQAPDSVSSGTSIYTGTDSGTTDFNLSNGTTYYYSIFAKDTLGNYSPPSQKSGMPDDGVPPFSPSNFVATKSNGEITLSWFNPAKDFAGVLIRRSETSMPETVEDGDLVYDGNLETIVDTGRVNESIYYYRIWSYDAVGNHSETPVTVTANAIPVLFPDPNFESVIRAAIRQPSGITFSDALARVDRLNADIKGISSIEGIQYLTNLTTLYLNGNQINDINALSGLTNLRRLGLQDNEITDISMLSGLTNLTTLRLYSNQISDVSSLSGLTNLIYLSLSGNQISDISVLSDLINLRFLYLPNNQISDISALSGLTSLTDLSLGGNQISDISAISGLTSLTLLLLGENQINDTSALSGLTNLTLLSLSRNQISDIDALSGFTSLTSLWLHTNQIDDIGALSGLTNLDYLSLENNQINDISPISSLTNLTKLILYNNQIIDISAISGLTSLTLLFLGENQIVNIEALSGLTNLRGLTLNSNQINNINALSGLTNLVSLRLQDNPFDSSPGTQARDILDSFIADGTDVIY